MYRYSDRQINLEDFKQPLGINLKESNRCVKKTNNPVAEDRDVVRHSVYQPQGRYGETAAPGP